MLSALRVGVLVAIAVASAGPVVHADSPGSQTSASPSATPPSPSAGSGSSQSAAPANSQTLPASARQPARIASNPPLDLATPPINHVLSPEQVQAMTTEVEEAPPEDIAVQGDRVRADVPLGQLQALPWALVHPLQAWRIFAPVSE